MSKTLAALLLAMMATACTGDESPAGAGDDILPMRGERTGDPTIVSAVASCAGRIVLPDSPPTTPPNLEIEIDGSDPMGESKLGHCAVTIGSVTNQDSFYDGSCDVAFLSIPCEHGKSHVVGITISNETGGVTTASVTLTVAD
jgi:hypothetical protein